MGVRKGEGVRVWDGDKRVRASMGCGEERVGRVRVWD